jgi:ribosomal protein S27E
MKKKARFITVRCTGCKQRLQRWETNTHQCPYCGRDVVEVKDGKAKP